MSTVAERVAAGVRTSMSTTEWWRPRVKNAINLNALDVGDGRSCVLGQRCPAERFMRSHLGSPFDAQLRNITRGRGLWAALEPWAVQHGFASGRGYYLLTAEWKRVIKARRAGAS